MMIPKNNVFSEFQSKRLSKAVTAFLNILEDVKEKEGLEMSAIISIAYIDPDKKKFTEIAGTNDVPDELLTTHFVQSEVLSDVNQRVIKKLMDIEGDVKHV